MTDTPTPEQSTPDGAEKQPDNGNAEAAKRRRQLRETEAERDALRAQLTAQRRSLLEWRAANHPGGPIDPQLLAAAGLDLDDVDAFSIAGDDDTEIKLVGDTGVIDLEQFDVFAESVAKQFNVTRVKRGPLPNPQQGNPGDKPAAGWSSIIKG
jgi:hypothetical protein